MDHYVDRNSNVLLLLKKAQTIYYYLSIRDPNTTIVSAVPLYLRTSNLSLWPLSDELDLRFLEVERWRTPTKFLRSAAYISRLRITCQRGP